MLDIFQIVEEIASSAWLKILLLAIDLFVEWIISPLLTGHALLETMLSKESSSGIPSDRPERPDPRESLRNFSFSSVDISAPAAAGT